MTRVIAGMALLTLLLAGCIGPYTWPEDQDDVANGPVEVTNEWQVLCFREPLQISEEAAQQLRLALDGKRFEPNLRYDQDDYANQFNPRRDDGVLIRPEILLVGDTGEEVRVYGMTSLGVRDGSLVLGFGPHDGNFDDFVSPLPEIPDDIEQFEALRIRSNEPFTIEALHWSVDRHPDLHRCGRRCTWLERWLMGE